MRTAFVETLLRISAQDKRICLLTGDLGFMVLEKYAAAYPDRFFNVGIAEANMVNLATGLALDGWIPYVYSIATFASMRGYEQIRNGPVLHKLPVRIAIVTWIERTYHRRRRQRVLGRLTPVEFEILHTELQAA